MTRSCELLKARGWRGRRESDSQAFCRPNWMHARDGSLTEIFHLHTVCTTTTTSVAILAQVILASGGLSCAATAKLSRFTILPSS